MATSGITWTETLPQLATRITEWGEKLLDAILDLGDHYAALMESYAKANAPWNDQTGAARQSIFAEATKAAAAVTITLAGSVAYFVYLELGTSKMAARPILMPTIEVFQSQIMAALQALIG